MKYLVVNTEAFQKGTVPEAVIKFASTGRCHLIFDEASYIKCNTPMAERKKSARNLAIRSLAHAIDGIKLALTGTPVSKSPVNLYDIMDFLKASYFPENMFEFAEKYTIRYTLPRTFIRSTISQDVYTSLYRRMIAAKARGRDDLLAVVYAIQKWYKVSLNGLRHIIRHKDYEPFMQVDSLMKRIENDAMFVRKEDVLDLPPKTYEVRTVSLTDEQKKLYKEFTEHAMIEGCVVENGLELYTRLQDICNGYKPQDVDDKTELIPLENNPKIDCLKEVLEQIGDHKVVVFCNRTRLLEDAIEAIKNEYSVARYDGKITDKQKEQTKEDWTSNKVKVIIANQASAGFGLDWLKDAHYCVFLSNDCSVERRLQAEARIYRGGIDNVSRTYVDIYVEHTVEDKVLQAQRIGKDLVNKGVTDASVFDYEEVIW